MSEDNVQVLADNEGSADSDVARELLSSQSNSPPLSSNGSSVPDITDKTRSPGRPPSCNGIVEVSDKEDDADEDDINGHFPYRNLHVSTPALLRGGRAPPMLMACGHASPGHGPIKQWASNGRTWCPTCNPLTKRNTIKNSEDRSGWRQTMNNLIEHNVFPAHVLNSNETFCYNGDNAGKIHLPKLPSGQPFMMDLDLFFPLVCADDLCHIPFRALTCFRAFILNDTRVNAFYNRVHPQTLAHFSVNLIETAIRVMEDPTEQGDVVFRRSKVALQIFYNSALRVPCFRELIVKHQLSQFLSLLRIDFLRQDVISCVCITIREMHNWFFCNDDLYLRLLSDMILIWGSPVLMTDNRSVIQQLFYILLDTDPSFLCNCFKMMEREIFSELLAMVDNLLQQTSLIRGKEIENGTLECFFNSSNLYFCLDLLEVIDKELNEGKHVRYDFTARLSMLVDIIYFCGSFRLPYEDILHNNQKAITSLCGILRAIASVQINRPASIVTGIPRISTVPPTKTIRVTKESIDAKANQENKEQLVKTRPVDEKIISASIRQFLHSNGNGVTEENKPSEEEKEDSMEAPEKILMELTKGKLVASDVTKSSESIVEPVAKQPRIDATAIADATNLLNPKPRFDLEDELDEDDVDEDEDEEVDDEEEDEDDEEVVENNYVEGIFGQRAESFFQQYLQARAQKGKPEDTVFLALPTNIRVYQMIASKAMPAHIFPTLKQSTLRAIGCLCRNSPKNQLAAGKHDVIPLVLQCALRQESERSSMIQLAVMVLKTLCVNCPENQARLLDVTDSCHQFIDGPRLIAAMGFKVITGDNGKRSMVPLVDLVPQQPPAPQPASPNH